MIKFQTAQIVVLSRPLGTVHADNEAEAKHLAQQLIPPDGANEPWKGSWRVLDRGIITRSEDKQ